MSTVMRKQLSIYFVILSYLNAEDTYHLQGVSRRFYNKIIPYVISNLPTKLKKTKDDTLYHF